MEPQQRNAHIFPRQQYDHYVEPHWVSQRLFDKERFYGPVLDPACGWGRILRAAKDRGLATRGSDIVDRLTGDPWIPWPADFRVLDFLGQHSEETYNWWRQAGSIVTNPPYVAIEEFARRALSLVPQVAFLIPSRRLNASRWLRKTPLQRVWLLTPRPSIPTGEFIRNGGKVTGGTVDYCWLVWNHGYVGAPELKWLHRDDDGN